MKNLAQLFETLDFKIEVKSVEKGVIAYLQVKTKGAKTSSYKEIVITTDSYEELMATDIVKVVDDFNAQGMRVMDITTQVEASISQAEKDAPKLEKKIVKKKATISKPTAQQKAEDNSKKIEEEKKAKEAKEEQKIIDDNNKREDLYAEERRIKENLAENARIVAEKKKAKEEAEAKVAPTEDEFDFDF